MSRDKEQISILLREWETGTPPPEALVVVVYDELRRLAGHEMKQKSGAHTLQPTALVHEAWLRLASADVAWKDRAHFFALAARTMRRVLVDHARAKHAKKRGEGTILVEFDERLVPPTEVPSDVLQLDAVLTALAREDPRMGQIVELHYFGGSDYREIATALSISAATVGRELRLARAWMRRELSRKHP